MSHQTVISVIGSATPSEADARLAHEVGAEIARRGGVVLTGGLGGVMAAASRGAQEAGGLTVGVLPGSRRESANPWVTIPVVTGLGEARNAIVAASGQVVIAIGGSLGTLTEIAFALKRGTPVIGLGTWELDAERSGGLQVRTAADPAAAIELALSLVESD